MLRFTMTQRGCRSDRGRCFSQLAWNPANETVVCWFTDGSVYQHSGPSLETYLETWVNHLDPGCIANGYGIGKKTGSTVKLKTIPPNLIHLAVSTAYTPTP